MRRAAYYQRIQDNTFGVRNVTQIKAKPFSHDIMKQARIERSNYQQELIRGFMRSIIARFPRGAVSPPAAPAHLRQA